MSVKSEIRERRIDDIKVLTVFVGRLVDECEVVA